MDQEYSEPGGLDETGGGLIILIAGNHGNSRLSFIYLKEDQDENVKDMDVVPIVGHGVERVPGSGFKTR